MSISPPVICRYLREPVILHGEAGVRQVIDLLIEEVVVPRRKLCGSVVREAEGLRFLRVQVFGDDDRHLGEAELVGGLEPGVPRDDDEVFIDDDRGPEPEIPDAGGHRVDGFLRDCAGVGPVRLQLPDREHDEAGGHSLLGVLVLEAGAGLSLGDLLLRGLPGIVLRFRHGLRPPPGTPAVPLPSRGGRRSSRCGRTWRAAWYRSCPGR